MTGADPAVFADLPKGAQAGAQAFEVTPGRVRAI